MTLLRLIQRASILAGMTLAGLSIYSNPAHADDAQFCAVTNSFSSEMFLSQTELDLVESDRDSIKFMYLSIAI